jgi:hypothetical protein
MLNDSYFQQDIKLIADQKKNKEKWKSFHLVVHWFWMID